MGGTAGAYVGYTGSFGLYDLWVDGGGEKGYSGTGPLPLALSLLCRALCNNGRQFDRLSQVWQVWLVGPTGP